MLLHTNEYLNVVKKNGYLGIIIRTEAVETARKINRKFNTLHKKKKQKILDKEINCFLSNREM